VTREQSLEKLTTGSLEALTGCAKAICLSVKFLGIVGEVCV